MSNEAVAKLQSKLQQVRELNKALQEETDAGEVVIGKAHNEKENICWLVHITKIILQLLVNRICPSAIADRIVIHIKSLSYYAIIIALLSESHAIRCQGMLRIIYEI